MGVTKIEVGQPNFNQYAFVDVAAEIAKADADPQNVPFAFDNVPGIEENTYWNAYWSSYGNMEESTMANRFWGVAIAAGGMAQTLLGLGAAGIGVLGTPFTVGASNVATIAGVGVAIHGVDTIQAGIRQAISGKHTPTMTAELVESATGSPLAGALVDAGIGFGGTLTAAKILKANRVSGVMDDVKGAMKGSYSHLKDHPSVGPGKDFTKTQKQKILEANKARNGGVLRDDTTHELLVAAQKSRKGVTPPPNEAQIDHVHPKSLGGSNSFSNAQVLSRENNRIKSNKLELDD